MIRITETRVRCCCGRTHALLPVWMVPHSRISLSDHAYIITDGTGRNAIVHIQLRLPDISESGIRHIIMQYEKQ